MAKVRPSEEIGPFLSLCVCDCGAELEFWDWADPGQVRRGVWFWLQCKECGKKEVQTTTPMRVSPDVELEGNAVTAEEIMFAIQEFRGAVKPILGFVAKRLAETDSFMDGLTVVSKFIKGQELLELERIAAEKQRAAITKIFEQHLTDGIIP